MKILIIAVLISILSFIEPSVGADSVWTDVCESGDSNEYCDHIGKGAYNSTGAAVLRAVRLGTIAGVAWRPKGSIISLPGSDVRTSPRNAYYFIVDDGGAQPFIRQAREIKPK